MDNIGFSSGCFFKQQAQSTPVFINLENRTYALIDTTILNEPKTIVQTNHEIIAEFKEGIWLNSRHVEKNIFLKISTTEMKPIEEFYSLIEETLLVPIFKWSEGQLEITYE